MSHEAAQTFQGSPQLDDQWRLEPGGPSGRIQAVVSLAGQLDPSRVAAALGHAVARHESLRTTFTFQPGISMPLQVVHDELEPAWHLIDSPLTDTSPLLVDERRQPIDFEHGPLVRAAMVRVDPDHHLLILTLSTLCADAASLSLLVGEIAHQCGAAAALVPEPLQYADFSAWALELSDSAEPEAVAARAAWSALASTCAPRLPFTGTAADPFTPVQIAVELPQSAPPALVHAAWAAVLSRVTGEREVTISYLSADRRHADLDGAIGAFARAVPITVTVDPLAPFSSLVADVESSRMAVLELADYAPSRPPELTVGFADYDNPTFAAGEIEIALQSIEQDAPGWRLWLSCPRTGDRTARISFDPAIYRREDVERLAARLQRLIGDAVSRPDTITAALELMDGHERAEILEGFNATGAAGADNICARFAAAAAATPSRHAVADEHGALTYAELDARTNQLAHRLAALGVAPDVTVGLCTDRSVEMVVGLLGILKAGGAYVPLNYEHPRARLGQQLDAAGARLIVTQANLLSHLPDSDAEIICLDRESDRSELAAQPMTFPAVELTDADLAYVIYTSGSTGTPKGVAVTHGNLTNYVADITHRFGADTQPLAFGLVTSISTDLGNTSVFGALGSGGTLVVLSPAASADPAAMSAQLRTTPVDILKITPSHLGALLTAGDSSVLPRAALVLGGERAPWDLVERIRDLSDVKIFNHYGPTETTIGCCVYAVGEDRGPYAPMTVPIGRPLANTVCYVLDDLRQPVPTGVPGRLFTGGAGVARGYIGQPELTAERFTADPFASSPSSRVYDTGDVARWLPDGTLEFLGRIDDQVKIRGYRVEPAEVETALRSHGGVDEAVVIVAESPAGESRLVAYVTGAAATREEDLRGHLTGLLPDFMLPSAIVQLDAMPRTPSGKIDRLSLPDPSTVTGSDGPAYIAPRSPVEQAIAAVWAQTLGVEEIGVQADFFELGGHSLLATQVVAQVRSEFDVDLPLHSLFTCPTVELLAAEIVTLMGDREQDQTATLLAELEGLSDEEAERLLADESAHSGGAER